MSSATARAIAPASPERPTAVAVAGATRVQAHGHLEDGAERAVGPGEQLGQVVPGHVLDHLAAALRARAVGERDAHADHEVAHAAVAGAERPGVGGGHHAADGGAAVGWVEGEHLARLGERALSLGQRDARLEHGGQVARVVLDDPVEARRGQLDFGLERRDPGPRQLGAGAAHTHRPALGRGGLELGGELVARRHQKRSATPACSSGWRR